MELGNTDAMYNLALMHTKGEGGPVDFAAARRLYSQILVKIEEAHYDVFTARAHVALVNKIGMKRISPAFSMASSIAMPRSRN